MKEKSNFSLMPSGFCKAPTESLMESIWRFAELHNKPQRNQIKKKILYFMLDLNFPNITKYRAFGEKYLVRHFGSRKKWRFKSGSTMLFVSQPSRLSFIE